MCVQPVHISRTKRVGYSPRQDLWLSNQLGAKHLADKPVKTDYFFFCSWPATCFIPWKCIMTNKQHSASIEKRDRHQHKTVSPMMPNCYFGISHLQSVSKLEILSASSVNITRTFKVAYKRSSLENMLETEPQYRL